MVAKSVCFGDEQGLGGAGGPLIFARCISRVLSGEREDRCECDLLLSRPVKLNYYDRYR